MLPTGKAGAHRGRREETSRALVVQETTRSAISQVSGVAWDRGFLFRKLSQWEFGYARSEDLVKTYHCLPHFMLEVGPSVWVGKAAASQPFVDTGMTSILGPSPLQGSTEFTLDSF